VINTKRKPEGVKVEVGLLKKSYCQWVGVELIDWMIILSVPFYSYHFVQYQC